MNADELDSVRLDGKEERVLSANANRNRAPLLAAMLLFYRLEGGVKTEPQQSSLVQPWEVMMRWKGTSKCSIAQVDGPYAVSKAIVLDTKTGELVDARRTRINSGRRPHR